MAGVEHRREPCPDRIVDDAGSAFAVGAVLGSMYYFTTGAWAHRYAAFTRNGHALKPPS